MHVRPTRRAWRGTGRTGDDTISLTRYTNLTFYSPVAMLQDPGDNSRWFIVQQDGNVRTFPTSNPTTHTGFIDISGRVASPGETGAGSEMGLLGMAFHPDFPQDPRVFLSYTNANRTSIISSFRTTNNGATLDPGTEQPLLTIDHPQTNHKGGNIAFGPDGLLYIGIGDGGGADDDHGNPGNGQSRTTMLGKMLRINVGAANATTYTIPTGNPFFNVATPMTSVRRAAAPAATRPAPRSTPTASAIRGAGASIAATATCGWAMSVRATGKRSTWSPPAATTAGAVAKARTTSTAAARPAAVPAD